MVQATKKQMVEFINSRCRVKGKKIPKTRLNQLSEEELRKVISASGELEEAFRKFVESEETAGEAKPDPQLTEALEALVDRLMENPTDFLTIMQFRTFMADLPYGSVSFDTLSRLTEKVMEKDSATAFLLLKYSTDQGLHLQKKKK